MQRHKSYACSLSYYLRSEALPAVTANARSNGKGQVITPLSEEYASGQRAIALSKRFIYANIN
ncbi:hypothetical protein NIES25_07720 [Nostoc linckia NIES-25]|nr:hypothetical protein NIES25_07720 [Nostoc linckia NIES-25]